MLNTDEPTCNYSAQNRDLFCKTLLEIKVSNKVLNGSQKFYSNEEITTSSLKGVKRFLVVFED